MKFGKQFEFYKIPEWSEFYFDYNGVKTVLKFIDIRQDKKKQLKKLKKLKKKLRKFSAEIASNSNNLLNTNDENINIKLVINSKEEEQNIIKEKDNDDNNLIDDEKDKDNEKANLTEPMLKQKLDDNDSKDESKPFLEGEKVTEHFLTKTEKIMEAEDLSGLPNDQKLEKFLKIYKEKLSHMNEFFLKKLEEFEEKYKNTKKKMDKKNEEEKNNYREREKKMIN